MLGNTFGTLFRVSSFGESHGPALGVIIDGCPSGLELDLLKIQQELDRRRPGQSKLVTQRKELDRFELLSGVFEGKTTGMPLAFLVRNEDARSKDYQEIKSSFRPGHADFTYFAKYRHRDYRGGGRSSARETLCRVIAGAVARQILSTRGIAIRGGLVQLGTVKAERRVWSTVEENELRCVDPDKVEEMRVQLELARKSLDSLGGVVEVEACGVPPGLGEPVFGRIDAMLAGALMSIPAAKGVEIGAGFGFAALAGSKAHDEMSPTGFCSNNHGGILGGISSGAPIVARVVFKPTASIPQARASINQEFSQQSIVVKGRHDPCVAIRGVCVVEAMTALVLIDLLMQDAASRELRQSFSPIEVLRYGMIPPTGSVD